MTDRSLRVLYVDDDPGLARLVQKGLERRGYAVETAQDGDSGLRRIEQGGIDVVALDHYMPGQDGLETLARIRALPDPPPVVYVTGTQESSVAVAALKAGASDYVVKTIGEEFLPLLTAAIEQAMHAVGLRRAKNSQFHPAFSPRLTARLPASRLRCRASPARPSEWPAAYAIVTYSGVHTAPNAQGGGCQLGFRSVRYQVLSASTARAPAVAVAATAAAAAP